MGDGTHGKQRSREQLLTQLPPEDRRTLDDVARDYVAVVMVACRGNRTNAARALGIDRKTLARNLHRWGIDVAPQPHALEPGSLVAIEGIDGAGITTQARLLVHALNERGHHAIYTEEPSEGPIGQFLRGVLADKSSLSHAAALQTLSLMFAADRIDHFERTVAPALAAGTTVVSDRWYHSSLAYQRTAVEREWIMAVNRRTRTPDITVVLEVRPEVGQQRRQAIGRADEFFHDLATQREVVAGYRATIAELRTEGERIEVLDGERAPAVIAADVLRALGLDAPR